MSCETPWKDYIESLNEHSALTDRVRQYTVSLGEATRTRPILLVRGDTTSWLRYATEVEHAARRQREALERYLESVLTHEAGGDASVVVMKTRLIGESDIGDRPVLTAESAPILPHDAAVDATLKLACGSCGAILVDGASDMITGLIFKCPVCGAHSTA